MSKAAKRVAGGTEDDEEGDMYLGYVSPSFPPLF